MQITFLTRKFRNGERNLHCDVVHITTKWVSSLTLDCNGVFAIKAYGSRFDFIDLLSLFMVYSVPTGQLVFSSRPVVRTVRYVIPLVNTSGQVGEYFVHRVRKFIWPSPSWRKKRARTGFFNIITQGQFIFLHCYFVCRKIDASSIIIRQLKTAPARAFIFSGNVVGFQRATYASQCKLRRRFNISHKK